MSHYNLPPASSSLPLSDQNIPARYKLQFTNKVKKETFTTDLVRDETGVPITVEIYDSYTRSRVSPDCFLSSAKVKVTVVDAERWKNRVNWSRSELVENVLTEREGKRPILTGLSLIIQLKNGVGTFENIVFNDNSSWTKSGFRLAAMVKGEGEDGYLNGQRVQEGVSEPFRVKDRRGKASKKPDRLELTHSVRCIKKIGKDRDSFLQKKNINTVENFLELYYNNQSELREILHIKSESGKEWESMIEHVTQCAGEYNAKRNASNNSSKPRQNCMIQTHPMEGRPSESYIIEGDAPAISGQHVPNLDIPRMNLSNEQISTGRTVQYTGETHYPGGDGGNYGNHSIATTSVADPVPVPVVATAIVEPVLESTAPIAILEPASVSVATDSNSTRRYMELPVVATGTATSDTDPFGMSQFTAFPDSSKMDGIQLAPYQQPPPAEKLFNEAPAAFNESNWIPSEVAHPIDGVVPPGSSLAPATEGLYQQYMELGDIVFEASTDSFFPDYFNPASSPEMDIAAIFSNEPSMSESQNAGSTAD